MKPLNLATPVSGKDYTGHKKYIYKIYNIKNLNATKNLFTFITSFVLLQSKKWAAFFERKQGRKKMKKEIKIKMSLIVTTRACQETT